MSNLPVICRYACVGRTGKVWLPRMRGVAKSASEDPNRSRNELATAGMLNGRVTVLRILLFSAPSERAASSKLELIVLRMEEITMYETGKYVRVSAMSVPENPYILKFCMFKSFNSVPFGPNAMEREMEDVNGGDMRGNMVIALIITLSHFGMFVLLTNKARI